MIKGISGGGVLAVFFVVGFAADSAVAQFTGYRPPGQGIEEPASENRRQRLDREIELARWTVGPFHLQPWVGIRDFVYSSGSETTGDSDVGVAIGAGLLSFLRIGPNFVLTAQATPEYLWWQRRNERSRGHQRYAGDLYGLLNRLQLRVGASRLDDLEIASAEANDFVSRRHDDLEAEVELRVYRRLHFFVEGSTREVRSLEELPEFAAFSTLDQDEFRLAGGFRLRLGDALTAEVGLQVFEIDFLDPSADRSSDGTYASVALVLDRDRYLVRGRFGLVDREPTGGSGFASFEGPLWDAGVRWKIGRRSRVELQLSRDLLDSARLEVSNVRSDRLDVRVSLDLYRRSRIGIFSQLGTDDYLAVSTGEVVQRDDLRSFGASLSLPLGNLLDLNFLYTILEYDSNVPFGDRRFDRLTVNASVASFGDVFAMR